MKIDYCIGAKGGVKRLTYFKANNNYKIHINFFLFADKRSFCNSCIQKFFSRDEKRTSWKCYLCDLTANKEINIHDDWKSRILESNTYTQIPIEPSTRRRLKIFSAFDGISTGTLIIS